MRCSPAALRPARCCRQPGSHEAVPHKDFSELYEEMSERGESAVLSPWRCPRQRSCSAAATRKSRCPLTVAWRLRSTDGPDELSLLRSSILKGARVDSQGFPAEWPSPASIRMMQSRVLPSLSSTSVLSFGPSPLHCSSSARPTYLPRTYKLYIQTLHTNVAYKCAIVRAKRPREPLRVGAVDCNR